jgi:hypothetical protein
MLFTFDLDEHLIQMPNITRFPLLRPNPFRVILAKMETPLTDGFVGNFYASIGQNLLYIPKT